MSKNAKPEVKSEAVKSAVAPSFKSFCRSLVKDGAPRGLKVAKNEAGSYVFTYGTKSAPICVLASVGEMVDFGLSLIGLKLKA